MDIISQIDRWAELLPDKPAHISGERTLTYGELRRQSDSVANYLAAHVAGREPVAVLGHREPEMLIAFIGCIKAGHPYIPVDTVLPKQRMERILAAASYTLTPDGVAEIARSTPPEPPAAAIPTQSSSPATESSPRAARSKVSPAAWRRRSGCSRSKASARSRPYINSRF